MKKLYIPTSTLNFNNILSSESISPKAFYDKRGFGYTRWATIPENPFNNAIVLYDNLCFFERPKSDLEDHSLLVEVLLDETQFKQTDGFWYSDHTIYLAPTTTRFLFFTETDKTVVLSISEASLETKLMRLYARQIQTIQKPKELFKPISLSNEPCGLNELEIEKDTRINKMKGLLYGYYIGSLFSSDSDSVKHLNVLKEIHNIFAAILSSFEKRPTAYQNERLDALFDYLNEQNADFKSLFEIISSSIDNLSKTKKVWSWIFGKRGYVNYEDKSVWLSYLQYATENDNKENQAITWIKSNIEEAKRRMYAKRHLLSPDEGEMVVMDNNVSSLKNPNITDEMESRLCVSWLNETLSDKNTNGKISTYKEELAKNLTLIAKEVYQDSWEGSPTRTYLNDLRRHVAGEEFKYGWNNGLLSSIAAVIIAGDDWEKLLSFMQSKEMTDYKLAFAFYGTLNGFANLTRDFTDVLYCQDKNYVWDVYKEFYGQLYGESLTNNYENPKPLPTETKSTEKQDGKSIDSIFEIISKLEKSKCGIKRDKIRVIAELYQKWGDNSSMFLNEVSKIKGIGKKTIEKIMAVLEINPVVENELFDDSLLITQLDCSKGLDAEKKEQLVYWWKIAQKKWPDNKDEFIKYFINLCKKEGRGESVSNYQALNGYFTQEVADQYEKELRKRYVLQ